MVLGVRPSILSSRLIIHFFGLKKYLNSTSVLVSLEFSIPLVPLRFVIYISSPWFFFDYISFLFVSCLSQSRLCALSSVSPVKVSLVSVFCFLFFLVESLYLSGPLCPVSEVCFVSAVGLVSVFFLFNLFVCVTFMCLGPGLSLCYLQFYFDGPLSHVHYIWFSHQLDSVQLCSQVCSRCANVLMCIL